MTLYELTGQYLALMEMAEAGEVSPEELTEAAKNIEGAIEDKADNIARILAQLKANAEGITAEIERLKARKDAISRNADSLKEYLQNTMLITGKTKFKTNLFSFNIQKNPASVVIDDESAIPEEYWIQQAPKLDKAAIKEALGTGEIFDFAHLEQKQSLRIR